MTSGSRMLMVNADDLGWSKSVNRGILECHETGIVTSCSLLAGGIAFEDAVGLVRAAPSLSVGVHLQLYRGKPILPPESVPSLVGEDGFFLGSIPRIVSALSTGRFDRDQVRRELGAQIAKLRDAGIEPSHLDSEKHLHLWPWLFDLVCRLAVENGVPYVRLVRDPPSARPVGAGLGVLSLRDKRVARRCGLTVPDGTIGVTADPSDLETLERILFRARGRRVEFIVHPGYLDDEFRELQKLMPNKLIEARERQLEVLRSPKAFAAVAGQGFTLAQSLGER